MRAEAPCWEAEFSGYRLIFGADSLDRVGELAREVGGTRVLVVTDPGVRDAGIAERAVQSLRGAAVEAFVFSGVEPNPTTRHVEQGVELAHEHAVDCLVGLGGGSALDCAKGINFLLTNGGRMQDYRGMGQVTRPMLPSLGVPTTAGTGSEAQSYALISDERTKEKMACGDKQALFRRVILDPALASSAPRSVAGIAGIDAVSHAVESYVTKRRNPISQLLAREAWGLLDANLPVVADQPDDLVAWGGMLLGAHLAGAAIEQSMLGAAHACANPLTVRFQIPHGSAVGLMLPHVMRFNAGHVGELYEELQLTLEERVCELCSVAGLPASLRDYQVPRDCLPELAAEAEKQWTAGHNPRPVGRQELLQLYEAAHV